MTEAAGIQLYMLSVLHCANPFPPDGEGATAFLRLKVHCATVALKPDGRTRYMALCTQGENGDTVSGDRPDLIPPPHCAYLVTIIRICVRRTNDCPSRVLLLCDGID